MAPLGKLPPRREVEAVKGPKAAETVVAALLVQAPGWRWGGLDALSRRRQRWGRNRGDLDQERIGWRVACDFRDQLVADGAAEVRKAARNDDESRGASDDAVGIVLVEIGDVAELRRVAEDGEAVDGDLPRDRLV